MKLKIFLILNIILLSCYSLVAQDNWKISAQIRCRSEIDNKDFNENTAAVNLSYLRTRLGFNFMPGKNLEGFIQAQDSRLFGEESSTLTDGSADNFDMHQAYFLIKDIFDFPLDLKLGRMEVVFGPQRLIGAVDWHNIGRSFDGGILKYKTENLNIDFFSFKEREGYSLNNTRDRILFGAYADIDLSKKYQTQAFLIWQREKPLKNLDRYTAGFYANGKFDNFYHITEFAYQGGKFDNMDVSAILVSLKVGHTFTKTSIAQDISLNVDYLSGDDNLADNKYKIFDTMYATNHKYYGFMDYFLNIPADTYNLGILDINAQIDVKLFDNNLTKLKIHQFNSINKFNLNVGNSSTDFGNEIDLTLSYKYDEKVSFVGGASYFFPGDIFKEIRGRDGSSWLYIMSVVDL